MPSVKTTYGSVTIAVNIDRFTEQYRKAQLYLGNQVLTDSDPYVPFIQGMLRNSGTVENGGRSVVWRFPYARYQYMGFAMEGRAPKVVTDRPLQYSTPGTGARWFEQAKSANRETWIREVRKIAGGG